MSNDNAPQDADSPQIQWIRTALSEYAGLYGLPYKLGKSQEEMVEILSRFIAMHAPVEPAPVAEVFPGSRRMTDEEKLATDNFIMSKFKPEQTAPVDETPGTKMARELRAECNNMTADEREEMFKLGMRIIYGGDAGEKFANDNPTISVEQAYPNRPLSDEAGEIVTWLHAQAKYNYQLPDGSYMSSHGTMLTDAARLIEEQAAKIVANHETSIRALREEGQIIATLKREIGDAPEGSHPDEQKPRAQSWHAERLNWINEVETLRAHAAKLQAERDALLKDKERLTAALIKARNSFEAITVMSKVSEWTDCTEDVEAIDAAMRGQP